MSLITTILNVPVPELPALPPGVMGQLGGADHDRVCHLRRLVFVGVASVARTAFDTPAYNPVDVVLAAAHFTACAIEAGARLTEVSGCIAHGADMGCNEAHGARGEG